MKPIVKIYVTETPGKITLTAEELEELISEAYNQGFEDGFSKQKESTVPWTSPNLYRGTDGTRIQDWSISTTSTPQTGSYTTTTATNLAPSAPTITNSATIDWARTKLSNKDKE